MKGNPTTLHSLCLSMDYDWYMHMYMYVHVHVYNIMYIHVVPCTVHVHVCVLYVYMYIYMYNIITVKLEVLTAITFSNYFCLTCTFMAMECQMYMYVTNAGFFKC